MAFREKEAPLPHKADLWRRARAGDRAARETLIETNLGLAFAVAKRFPANGLDREDLFQEAVIGLIKAVDSYDSERGAAFSTFAWHVISHVVFRSLAESGLIRVPEWRVQRRDPAPVVVSLDAPVRVDESDATLHDMLPADAVPLLDATMLAERARLVQEAVAQLTPPQQTALRQWAGLERGVADRWQVYAACKRLRRMPEVKKLKPTKRKH